MDIKNFVADQAVFYKVDKKLLLALVETESDFNPHAMRYEPQFQYTIKVANYAHSVGCSYETMLVGQKSSWGLGQIMAATAYHLGFNGWFTELLDPGVNLKYVCKYLNSIIKQQQLEIPEHIYAAYNAGSVRKNCYGELVNQRNVDRFLKNYDQLS